MLEAALGNYPSKNIRISGNRPCCQRGRDLCERPEYNALAGTIVCYFHVIAQASHLFCDFVSITEKRRAYKEDSTPNYLPVAFRPNMAPNVAPNTQMSLDRLASRA